MIYEKIEAFQTENWVDSKMLSLTVQHRVTENIIFI